MALAWIHEDTPRWDAAKAEVIGAAPAGAFDLKQPAPGDLAPGEWFRAEDDGKVAGYGWMDCTWGDAEVLLAVSPERRRLGVGAFILDRLEGEAAARGVNYLYNSVRKTHPDRDAVTQWLLAHGFQPSGDGLLKRKVRRG
jgi:GNAT superfamily N-acetyltransferase